MVALAASANVDASAYFVTREMTSHEHDAYLNALETAFIVQALVPSLSARAADRASTNPYIGEGVARYNAHLGVDTVGMLRGPQYQQQKYGGSCPAYVKVDDIYGGGGHALGMPIHEQTSWLGPRESVGVNRPSATDNSFMTVADACGSKQPTSENELDVDCLLNQHGPGSLKEDQGDTATVVGPSSSAGGEHARGLHGNLVHDSSIERRLNAGSGTTIGNPVGINFSIGIHDLSGAGGTANVNATGVDFIVGGDIVEAETVTEQITNRMTHRLTERKRGKETLLGARDTECTATGSAGEDQGNVPPISGDMQMRAELRTAVGLGREKEGSGVGPMVESSTPVSLSKRQKL